METSMSVIVDADLANVRNAILNANANFSVTPSNKLVFRSLEASIGQQEEEIEVEILQGDSQRQLKLPDAKSVPIYKIESQDGSYNIPIVHPAILVLTKVKRWMYIATSTRPASVSKARNDSHDTNIVLGWLAERNILINFAAYPEKPKNELLPGFRRMYSRHAEMQGILKDTMEAGDIAFVKN